MLQRHQTRDLTAVPLPIHLGAFLKMLRDRHALLQAQVLEHLPTWRQSSYSKVEKDTRAPTFDQLVPIYRALSLAGVQLTLQDRRQFVLLARKKIEAMKTRHERKSEAEWELLHFTLASIDRLPPGIPARAEEAIVRAGPPRFAETRHLVGRETWLASVASRLHEQPPKKVLVLQGPVGIGKSSELHRLARQFLHPASHVLTLFCELPSVERTIGPENALDMMLGELLGALGQSEVALAQMTLETRIGLVLGCLEKATRPVLVFLDNAENLLEASQGLAWCWERFLKQWLLWRHRATLVLATKEWGGWFKEDQLFVEVVTVPALEGEEGVLLLQRSGLQEASPQLLRQLHEVVGGVPQSLKWVASLVHDPMAFDSWELVDLEEEQEGAQSDVQPSQHLLERRIARLLDDPALLGVPVAAKLKPLLDRLVEERLSPEARQVLYQLSVANLSLGLTPLRALCPRPSLLQELKDASLLMAYEHRVQVLPLVAAALRTRLEAVHRRDLEMRLAEALFTWLATSKTMTDHEIGMVVTEIVEISLKHARLLEAAQLIIRYGWLSFRLGHTRRLAQLALKVLEETCQRGALDPEQQSGVHLLFFFLSPLLGQKVNAKQKEADYRMIYDVALSGTLRVHPSTLVFLAHNLMLGAMNEHHFEEARCLLEATHASLASVAGDADLMASLLEKRAWLFGRWCDDPHEHGGREAEQAMRAQSVTLYQQCVSMLHMSDASSSLLQRLLRNKRRAKVLNYIGYHLQRLGRFEEALEALLESLALQQQGHAEIDSLPPLYGDIAQTLLMLGRFDEAQAFDERAYAEAERLAQAGYTFSQEELHVHQASRANLYLHLGRIEEAEALLCEALPHIHPRRSMYQTMAIKADEEIRQWRAVREGKRHRYQLDWRYVDAYRELVSYDTYWWWAAAGPLNEQEQQAWDQWSDAPLDEHSKEQIGQVIRRARNREIETALLEHREPRLHYPALAVEEVRTRLQGLRTLDEQIRADEHLHPVVRRWYLEALEEEVTTLRLIEATYAGDSEQVRALNQALIPSPTEAEMAYAFSCVRALLQQGHAHVQQGSFDGQEHREAVREALDRLSILMQQIGAPIDLSLLPEEAQSLPLEPPLVPASTQTPSATLTFEEAKRVVEAVIDQAGYEGWSVLADPLGRDPHIEQALRQVYLPTRAIPIEQLKDYVRHELLDGHVARCVAGEQSLVGLLGIHLGHSLETEEGLAIYKEMQHARQNGRVYDETAIWFGTLAVGLAAGVVTPPQTFSHLFVIFDALIYLYRLVKRPDQGVALARERAQAIALGRCLRTFRGVPDLRVAGVCYTKDVLYQRGLHKLLHALEEDPATLERLAVGVVALEQLPELAGLGIVAAPQNLRAALQDASIDELVRAFARPQEGGN